MQNVANQLIDEVLTASTTINYVFVAPFADRPDYGHAEPASPADLERLCRAIEKDGRNCGASDGDIAEVLAGVRQHGGHVGEQRVFEAWQDRLARVGYRLVINQ